MALRLFLHALRMLIHNLDVTVKVSGVLFAAMLALMLFVGERYFIMAGTTTSGAGSDDLLGTALLMIAVQAFFSLWAVVAWHRFILLEETPRGLFPAFNASAIWRYFSAGVLTFVVILAVVMPMTIIGVIILIVSGAPVDGETGLGTGVLNMLIVWLPATYVSYRIAPMLPSAAIGPRLTVGQAWYHTGTSGLTFVWLALITFVGGYALHAIPELIAPTALPVALFLAAVANTVTVMVGASILTTIYGVYVENRDL